MSVSGPSPVAHRTQAGSYYRLLTAHISDDETNPIEKNLLLTILLKSYLLSL